MSFEELELEDEFDGVWACASLLHVPREQMRSVLTRLARAARPGAPIYWSVKLGDSERRYDQRLFTDYTPESTAQLVASLPVLELRECWVSESAKADCKELWVNTLTFRRHAELPEGPPVS